MLLIKRISASLINGAYLLISVIILGFVLEEFRIDLEHKYFLFLVFSIVYFIPIIVIKTNIGLRIMRINVSSANLLFLKYAVYFFIFSGCLSSLLHLFSETTSLSPIFNLSYKSLYAGVGIAVSIFIISTILFFASFGKYNLMDYIIKLSHNHAMIKRNEMLTLSIWLSSIMLPIIIFALIQSYLIYPENRQFPSLGKEISGSTYFPREIFDEYSFNELEAFEKTNAYITPMIYESFHREITIGKKTLYSVINKSTFDSPLKRYKLCLSLRMYSMMGAEIDLDEIDDTEIFLTYREPHTYYSNITYTYRYYVNSKYGVYGGVNLDSLNAYYKRNVGIFVKSLAEATNKSPDSISVSDAYNLTEEQKIQFVGTYIPLMQQNNVLTNVISFDAVKPQRMYTTNFPKYPPHMIVLTNPYDDNDYIESTNLRNYTKLLDNVFQYVYYTRYTPLPKPN